MELNADPLLAVLMIGIYGPMGTRIAVKSDPSQAASTLGQEPG
jgi:hypothetical protein